MKPDAAIKLVREMQRFESCICMLPNPRGKYVRNALIRRASRREIIEAVGHSDSIREGKDIRECKAAWVSIAKIKSEQRSLLYRGLLWQLRHPSRKRPTIVMLRDGTPILWDGNHRTTAAIMRGQLRIKCTIVKAPRISA